MDFDQFNLDGYKNPQFKPIKKNLWLTKNGFSVRQTNDGKFVWEQASVGEKPGHSPYAYSLKQMRHEILQRNRNQEKEVN